MSTEEDVKSEVVLNALEDSRFTWRTIEGIANQIGIQAEEVLSIIDKLIQSGSVIRSGGRSKDGKDLYTTRKRYREVNSLTARVASAFRNRAD